MDGINPLSKFLSPLISYICGGDTISVPGIVYGTIWGSFLVLGSFAVQFGDHLRYGDHLRARTDLSLTSFHSVAVGFAILCSQRWIKVNLNASTMAFVEI